MKEIWKCVNGYEEYLVSNYGNIKSRKYGKEKMLSFTKDKDGYYKVKLYKNKKCKVAYIHRLVAETFIDNPNNYNVVNHIDENKQNNNVKNLEWCSIKYNNNYGTREYKNNRKKYIAKVLLLLKNTPIKDENINDAIKILEKLK